MKLFQRIFATFCAVIICAIFVASFSFWLVQQTQAETHFNQQRAIDEILLSNAVAAFRVRGEAGAREMLEAGTKRRGRKKSSSSAATTRPICSGAKSIPNASKKPAPLRWKPRKQKRPPRIRPLGRRIPVLHPQLGQHRNPTPPQPAVHPRPAVGTNLARNHHFGLHLPGRPHPGLHPRQQHHPPHPHPRARHEPAGRRRF